MKDKESNSRKNPVKTRKGRNGGTLNSGGVYENSGRPKGVKNFKTAIEELFALPIDTLEEDIKLKILGINPRIKTLEEALNARMLLDALCGDSYSKKEILERMHGKVTDKVEVQTIDKARELTKEEIEAELKKRGIKP